MDNYGFVDTENDRKYHRPRVNRKGVRSATDREFSSRHFFTARGEEDDSLPGGEDCQHQGREVQPGHQGGVGGDEEINRKYKPYNIMTIIIIPRGLGWGQNPLEHSILTNPITTNCLSYNFAFRTLLGTEDLTIFLQHHSHLMLVSFCFTFVFSSHSLWRSQFVSNSKKSKDIPETECKY